MEEKISSTGKDPNTETGRVGAASRMMGICRSAAMRAVSCTMENGRSSCMQTASGSVAKAADKVAVMYAGKLVEVGTAEDVFYNPRHPYTWGLLSAIPDISSANERLYTIPGTPPNLTKPVKGDAFAIRNQYALEIDFEEEPPMFQITDTHFAATWLLHPEAPKVEMPAQLQRRIARMRG